MLMRGFHKFHLLYTEKQEKFQNFECAILKINIINDKSLTFAVRGRRRVRGHPLQNVYVNKYAEDGNEI